MRDNHRYRWILVFLTLNQGAVLGFAGHGASGGGHHGAGGPGHGGGFVRCGFGYAGFSSAIGFGFFPMVTPMFMYGAAGFPPYWSPGPIYDRGPVVNVPPPGAGRPQLPNGQGARIADPARAKQLMTLGDRLLRVNNTKRAEERYLQASRVDPHAAGPRVRLAQIAFIRGDYTEAAHRFREAQTVEPRWLETAFDVQSIYGEPGDFAKHIARLESRVHTHPEDRDAWLVLGAQWYLSGKTAKAADIFQRLDDPNRRPDIALAAFINVTDPQTRRKVIPEPPVPVDELPLK